MGISISVVHLDGTAPAPTVTAELAKWKIKDTRVMSWIIGSCESQIVLNLRPYKTAKTMWDYLKQLYNQPNTTRRFQLEYEIANYNQGSLSIQDYFSGFQNLWTEFFDIVCAAVPANSLADVLVVHEISKRDQFLMKLQSDFENARSNLMNHPPPPLDVCFSELLREERLFTRSTLEQRHMGNTYLAYSAQGKGKGRDMSKTQCFSSKNYGHIAANRTKKFCSYCKRPGHIIKECTIRPQNRQTIAFQAITDSSSTDQSHLGT